MDLHILTFFWLIIQNQSSIIIIRGSYEQFSSASAIVRRYQEEAGENSIKKEKQLTCREIFELSYTNSPIAVKVVKENAELVGIGLANLITIFAPEIIVLGGGMSEAKDSYLAMIRESAFANSLENWRSEVKIERAHQGPKASLMGSAYYGMKRLAGKSIWWQKKSGRRGEGESGRKRELNLRKSAKSAGN